MKRKVTAFYAALIVAAALSLAGCGKVTDADASSDGVPFQHGAEAAQLSLPAGTEFAIRMQQSVSSANAASGQKFDAVLDEPVVVNGQTLIPRGADVTGRVVAAKRSGRLQDPGYLRLGLESVSVNGRSVPVETSTVFIQGSSHKKRDWAMIGGGAGGGALIGALAGGGKGALIGSAVGAGAGTATAYATGKKDVAISAERRLMFRLTQPVNLDR